MRTLALPAEAMRWSMTALRERLVNDGADLAPMSMEQFGEFVRAEIGRNEALLREQFCTSDVWNWWGCFGPAVAP